MAKQPQLDKNGFRKFGMLDKVSYAAGDFGCNMSFALAGTYFTLFWTQYMKIDSLAHTHQGLEPVSPTTCNFRVLRRSSP